MCCEQLRFHQWCALGAPNAPVGPSLLDARPKGVASKGKVGESRGAGKPWCPCPFCPRRRAAAMHTPCHGEHPSSREGLPRLRRQAAGTAEGIPSAEGKKRFTCGGKPPERRKVNLLLQVKPFSGLLPASAGFAAPPACRRPQAPPDARRQTAARIPCAAAAQRRRLSLREGAAARQNTRVRTGRDCRP